MQSGVVFRDGVRLWTDTAFRDGRDASLKVIGHGPKGFVSAPAMSDLTGLHYAGVISSCGYLPQSAVERIGYSYPATLEALLQACSAALRENSGDGAAMATLLLGAWSDGPRLFLLCSQDLPDLPAFQPIERTAWFQPQPVDCPAYREGMAEGFDPQLAHDAVIASIDTPYENVLGRMGRWIAGNVIELTVSAAGVASRVIREGVPDQEATAALAA